MIDERIWQGGHVRDALGITVGTDARRSIVDVDVLVGVALRRNPKRAHLLVSTVLAKHVPTVPGISIAAGELLALLVSWELSARADDARASALGARLAALIPALAERPGADAAGRSRAHADLAGLRRDIRSLLDHHPEVVTLGFAETATGLGQLVGDAIGSYYLHSTRFEPEGSTPFAGFEEEHSHATDHRLLPSDPHWLREGGTVVLVDDELSTGTTAINTVTAIQALVPQRHWVIASLIDLRSAADRDRFERIAAGLGTRISVVSLGAGPISLPADVLALATREVESMPHTAPPAGEPGTVHLLDATGLPAVRSARFGGTDPVDTALAGAIADQVRPLLPATATASSEGRGVVVLGAEEFIALPMATADALDGSIGPVPVLFSTSTRSPIAPLDAADYPVAGAVRFRSHDRTPDGVGVRFAYNLTRGGRRFDAVVFMPEPGCDPALLAGDDGVLEALRRISGTVVVVLLRDDPPGPVAASGPLAAPVPVAAPVPDTVPAPVPASESATARNSAPTSPAGSASTSAATSASTSPSTSAATSASTSAPTDGTPAP